MTQRTDTTEERGTGTERAPDAPDGRPRSARRGRGLPRAGALLLCLLLGLSSCELLSGSSERRVVDVDLTATSGGWTPAFSDFTPGRADDLELTSGRRALPENTDTSTVSADSAMYLAGSNLSDDLFMYLKRPVDGLEPDAAYRVQYRIEIATAAPSGCVGIGGPPGEAVWMKGGASASEPTQRETDGYLDVDKGNQSTGGSNAVVLGNIANGTSGCTGEGIYTRKTLRTANAEQLTVRTSSDGTLWLFVGTESGFEGRTGLYYLGIRAVVERIDG